MSQELTQEQTAIRDLSEQVKELKVRTFDLQETLQSERKSFGQFVGVLSQLFDFDETQSQNLQNYVDEAAYLTGKADRPKDNDEAQEVGE